MRKFLTVAITLGVLAMAARLTAQQPPDVKPGPEHEKLKEAEGTWDAAIKCPLGDSKGSCTCKVGLNGLWLLENFKAEIAGKAFEGRGATTYDPAKKKYINVWIDSMSTRPIVCEGAYDSSSKTMSLVGDMHTPDGKSMKVTLTTMVKDANTKTFTIRGPGPDGKDMEMMAITYTRRAK